MGLHRYADRVDCFIMSILTIQILVSILCFVPAIVCHELMHGWAAYKLGDPTAKSQGRLSLNPLKHVDTFGTLILPGLLILAGGPVFGYAKPVPYNPSYFKDPRKGDLIVGLAGPFANLVLAVVAGGIAWALYPFADNLVSGSLIFAYFYYLFLPSFALINLYLMFFNLLPIPPLDGSSIFAVILPEKYLPQYYHMQRYALPFLFILIFGIPLIFSYFGISFDVLGMYLRGTAGNLASLLFPSSLIS